MFESSKLNTVLFTILKIIMHMVRMVQFILQMTFSAM